MVTMSAAPRPPATPTRKRARPACDALPPVVGLHRSAAFSDDGAYRYSLVRAWDHDSGDAESSSGHLVVVGMNPSTADAARDDPTIRRCIDFARRWGHTELRVVNLFAYRSLTPAALRDAADPVGAGNDAAIAAAAAGAGRVLCAWGSWSAGATLALRSLVEERVAAVLALLDGAGVAADRVCCLARLAEHRGGHPQHPLYARASTAPIPFTAGQAGEVAMIRVRLRGIS